MALSTYPDPIYKAYRNTRKEIVATGNIRNTNMETLANLIRYGNTVPDYAEGLPFAPTQAVYWKGVFTERSNFPIGGPLYTSIDPRGIYPWMHTMGAAQNSILEAHYNGNMMFVYPTDSHTTSNAALDPIPDEIYPIESIVPGVPSPYAKWNLPHRQSNVFQFRGSVTPVNPENDPEKRYIIENGLENTDKKNASVPTNATSESMASPGTPTSPIHPFTRSYAERAHNAIVTAYNRTRLPIADIEHRKAFRYIFITRPECYLLSNDGGTARLSAQASTDEDINACWCRMPHVIRALSPVYVCPSPGRPEFANWNYLLCNRVMGMSAGGQTLTVTDSITKGVRGATVTPGKIMTSNLGGTIELSFRDTKYMDVYEMLRIWMWYIHKRKTGQFFPPYDGYTYANNGFATGVVRQHMHPYDRALEYGASIFDIITNETGTKILYWCKYYGVLPTNVQTSILGNENASAITQEARVNASFLYQYKQENIFRNLVEFNFNAGIFDNMGNLRSDVASFLNNEVPFLYREDSVGGTKYTSDVLKNYIGASSLITGSPFIVSEVNGQHDPWKWNETGLVQSNLCFIPAHHIDETMAASMNLGITNEMPTKLNTSIFK